MVLRICLIVLFAFGSAAAQVNVKLVTDEAEAVLSALAKRKANQTITESDWQSIFQSEGYVRLKKRETSMQRSFEDADFKKFVCLTSWRNAQHRSKRRLRVGRALTFPERRDWRSPTYRKTHRFARRFIR